MLARTRWLPVGILALLWFGACRTAPIYDVVGEPLRFERALTEEEVAERIERAAEMQGWVSQEFASGQLVVTKRKGRHIASATVTYDTSSFSITFRNSVDFKQSGDRIHKLYNEWIRALVSTIQMEVSSPH
jgi:hypothetical protein